MTVSSDSGLIYVADNSFNFVCIDAATGNIQWSDNGSQRSGYMAEPKLSEIDGQNSMVYVIETNRGNVRQHNADDGSINWASDCIDRTNTNKCQDSVEAEFRYVFTAHFVGSTSLL
jgi:outer membrane protein assembly factor BamB